MNLLEFYCDRFPALVRTLENAVRRGRLAHAFLVQADSARTRDEFSRVLAWIGGCPQPVEGRPCGVCPVCRQFEHDAYAELYTLSPVGRKYEIPVGDRTNPEPNTLRFFIDRFSLTGTSGAARKVGIIYDADRMNTEAQNALLKTLEEPPRDTLLILATGNPSALLPTTVSRCQMLNLLENRIEFDFSGREELCRALADLYGCSGDLGCCDRAAGRIIAVAAALKDASGNRVEEEWNSRLTAAAENDDRLAKRLEKMMESAASGAYMKERAQFLSAIHSFAAQLYLLSAGADRKDLANPELFDGLVLPPLSEERALAGLQAAEELLFSMRFPVNEALALRNFAFQTGMAN